MALYTVQSDHHCCCGSASICSCGGATTGPAVAGWPRPCPAAAAGGAGWPRPRPAAAGCGSPRALSRRRFAVLGFAVAPTTYS